MIARYSRPEMVRLWEEQYKLELWLEVETTALEVMAEHGVVPSADAREVRAKGSFSLARTQELERQTKHDVIAFLTNVAEVVGPSARHLHRGMTSNDLLDTTFALQLTRSLDLILRGVDELLKAIAVRAEEYKTTLCIGRSHGIHAEPTTFGLKLASWYAELKRSRRRLEELRREVAVGKLSGAVGTYSNLNPAIERDVLTRLGLGVEDVSSQIVHRDRHAAFFQTLALLGTSIERWATEIRHLARTEVAEVEEEFTAGQKGSSAMPHKRNPILCENLCGLARVLRGYAMTALENIALWHERDISHSSAERIIAPDACVVLDFMLHRFTAVVRGMRVKPERMLENLMLTRGVYASGSLLLLLTDKGMTREDAYAVVQRAALRALDEGREFAEIVRAEPRVAAMLSEQELQSVLGADRHVRHVDAIWQRVFSSGGAA